MRRLYLSDLSIFREKDLSPFLTLIQRNYYKSIGVMFRELVLTKSVFLPHKTLVVRVDKTTVCKSVSSITKTLTVDITIEGLNRPPKINRRRTRWGLCR